MNNLTGGRSLFLSLILLAGLLSHFVVCEYFYDLLGVTRDASAREIRKAFKKLALTLHPDKNKDDDDAHAKFLQLNRAYEVLKDEDLRKKYDRYGEEGLKEDGPSGGGYHSWNYYNQDFGIYDDDQEIITLSRSDFEMSVSGTSDVWFINYYSPQCSHCHDLAPTWREVARELYGVIRIGAVNCADDWFLCRQNGIRSYPTIVIYPRQEKYKGVRSTTELVEFALSFVDSRYHELDDDNFESIVNSNADETARRRPWVISFCGPTGDCLEESSLTKLAAMLSELSNVGVVYCGWKGVDTCSRLQIMEGQWYFPPGEFDRTQATRLESLDPVELSSSILCLLPELPNISVELLKTISSEDGSVARDTWLVLFTEGSTHDFELRKLPSLLPDFSVGRADCSQMRTACNELHINKFPSFVVYKQNGGHEFHFGRHIAHDIAAFVRESAATPLTSLTPEDFPRVTSDWQKSWFIDFFAPWCPPCMRLLPEFRKASRQLILTSPMVGFGTVDCTVHHQLCDNYNVRSYPTTVLYNRSVSHEYNGHHSADDIVEFVQDVMDPPVEILDDSRFDDLVAHKASDELWLIDFYAPWCGPCKQLAPEWRRLAKMLRTTKGIHVGQVDCQAHRGLCTGNQVRSYPTIRLYPPGTGGRLTYHEYRGWYRNADSIHEWALDYLPSSVTPLDRQTFYSTVLPSRDPWLLDFYAPWCGHCKVFAPQFELVSTTLDGLVKTAKVNCDEEGALCEEAGVRAYPTVKFFPGSTTQHGQATRGIEIDSQNADVIINFVKNHLNEVKMIKDEL